MTQTLEIRPDRSFPEARLFLREYSHRINNELACAIGVISMAVARSESQDVREVLRTVQDQLQGFSEVHRALDVPEHSTTIDAGAYLRRLCRAISRSKLDANDIKLVLAEHPVPMDSERCWRMGLIVSELITNALRHAFKRDGGTICVELLPSGSFVECRVSDDGSSGESTSRGQGLKIIDALSKSLGGWIDQQFGPAGATSVLTFPADY